LGLVLGEVEIENAVVGSVRLVRSVLRLLANPVELAFWKKFCTAADWS